MANVLHEIRDYTIDPAWYGDYQTWAQHPNPDSYLQMNARFLELVE